MYALAILRVLEIPNSPPGQWDIVFNLPIPGWLPASANLGFEEIGIRYGLYATAKFTSLDDDQTVSPWSLATLCSPFRSRIRTIDATKKIIVRRYVLPPQVDRTPSSINYLVNAQSNSHDHQGSKKRIPANVLTKIQVLASVPECVDVVDNSIPLTLRLRTKDLEAEECKRLQVTELGINVLQVERCRCVFRFLSSRGRVG